MNVGELLTDESRMIVVAVYSLLLAHPGPIFGRSDANSYESDVTASSNTFSEKADPETTITQRNA